MVFDTIIQTFEGNRCELVKLLKEFGPTYSFTATFGSNLPVNVNQTFLKVCDPTWSSYLGTLQYFLPFGETMEVLSKLEWWIYGGQVFNAK